MIDITPFNDFDTFFSWYISIIKAKVPDFLSLTSDEIHKRIGYLTDEEFNFTCKNIRRIQQIPKGLSLMNDNNQGTFYAKWDKIKQRPVIAFPSIMMYWLKYPPLVRAIIQHELGHCTGDVPDILTNTQKFIKHSLVNISMDVRINQNIDYETLAQVYKCTYTFDNSFFEMQYVPEYWMPNKCGLPSSLKTKATWTWLYKSYEDFNPKDSNPEEQEEKTYKVGDYVQTLIDKHGFPKGTIGIVASVIDDIGKKNYIVDEATNDEVEALRNDDYNYFRTIANSTTPIVRKNVGKYEYKELKKIKVPVFNENEPNIGDIALLVVDKPTIIKGNFGMILSKSPDNSYIVNEFNDDVKNIILKNDFEAYMEILESGKPIFTNSTENCIYGKEFILNNLNPPPKGKGDNDTKQIEKPQVGDIVVISKGVHSGKYGVITEIIDDKHIIQEVSEEIAKIKTGRKF